MRQFVYSNIQRSLSRGMPAMVLWLAACSNATSGTPNHHPVEMPVASALTVTVPPVAFHTIDFMQLKQCALKETILKSKTRIAKFAKASQQLLLDLEFLQLAPSCIARLKRQRAGVLVNQLETASITIKRQLSGRIFNATLAARQYRQLWQPSGMPDKHTPETDLPLIALRDINSAVEAWLSGLYTAENLEFELQLSEVAKARVRHNQGQAHLIELAKLEALLQAVIPPRYRQWQIQRQTRLPAGNNYPKALSN